MSQRKGGLDRRIKTGLALAALCASLVGMSGCNWDEGYIVQNGLHAGEWTQESGGILVVLYRERGSPNDFNTSQFLLDYYKSKRKSHSIQTAAILTLRYLRQYCNPGGNPLEDYVRDRCLDALADDEWSDFRNDSLVPADHNPGYCIAVHVRGGENWTVRSAADRHCWEPFCEICRSANGRATRGQGAEALGHRIRG